MNLLPDFCTKFQTMNKRYYFCRILFKKIRWSPLKFCDEQSKLILFGRWALSCVSGSICGFWDWLVDRVSRRLLLRVHWLCLWVAVLGRHRLAVHVWWVLRDVRLSMFHRRRRAYNGIHLNFGVKLWFEAIVNHRGLFLSLHSKVSGRLLRKSSV